MFNVDGTAAQPSFGFTNNAGTGMFNTAGVLGFATGAISRLTISSTGTFNFAAPSGGVTLTVNGLSGTGGYAAQVLGGTTAGDRGFRVTGGTGSSDFSLVCQNAAATSNLLLVSGDGGVQLGAPTGGTLGLGTLNVAAGVSINNQPIYSGIPQNTPNVNYTTVLSDANKHLNHTGGGPLTYTIASNASVAYPVGTAITFTNPTGAGVLTIAINTDTLEFSPSGGTGSRTLAATGMATALKVAATTWMISGTGLT